MSETGNRVNWLNRERVLHEGVWDSLSRPLSRQSRKEQSRSPRSIAYSEYSEDMGLFSGTRVRWNHFGKKYTIRLSDYEMDYADLYDAFMKKIFELRPDFEGRLAFIDQFGRQSLISSDHELREALSLSDGQLKVHTMVSDGSVIAAADLLHRGPHRSQSVPPERSSHSYPPAHSRAPSSLESAPAAFRHRTLSPPPPLIQSPTSVSKAPVVYHQMPPAGYTYKYTTLGPYTQPILYGMPPTNGMLMRWLINPFNYGYTRSWMGPYKWWNYGGWNGSHMSGWGPIW